MGIEHDEFFDLSWFQYQVLLLKFILDGEKRQRENDESWRRTRKLMWAVWQRDSRQEIDEKIFFLLPGEEKERTQAASFLNALKPLANATVDTR